MRPKPLLRVDSWLDGLPRQQYPDVTPNDGKTRFRPYSAWPRCTRWISYRQTHSATGERVVGSWRFRSDWLAEKIVVGAAAAYVESYWDEVLARWLRQRANCDERVTVLPDNWGVIAFYLLIYLDNGDCRPFCMTCGRNVTHQELLSEDTGGNRGDMGRVVRCPHGHVLLDNRALIHVD